MFSWIIGALKNFPFLHLLSFFFVSHVYSLHKMVKTTDVSLIKSYLPRDAKTSFSKEFNRYGLKHVLFDMRSHKVS